MNKKPQSYFARLSQPTLSLSYLNLLLGTCALLFSSSLLHANVDGFTTQGQNTVTLGMAGAGGAVSTSSASTLYSNPAAMNIVQHAQFSANAIVQTQTATFRDASAASPLGTPYHGTNQGDMYADTPLYSLFMTKPIASYLGYDNLVIGAGLYSSYYHELNYENQFQGQLLNLQDKLMANTLSLTLSAPVFDAPDFTFGAGYLLTRSKYKASRTSDATNTASRIEIEGDDNQSDSFHLGLYYQVNDQLNVGAVYRSPISVRFDTKTRIRTTPRTAVDAQGSNPALPALDAMTLQGESNYALELPTQWEFAVHYRILPSLDSYLSWQRTDWKDNNKAIATGLTRANILTQIAGQTPAGLNDTQKTTIANSLFTQYAGAYNSGYDYHSADTIAIGFGWQALTKLQLRCGFAISDSTVNAEDRTLANPTNSSRSAAVGLGYRISQRLTFDLAAQHTDFETANVNQQSNDNQDSYFANIDHDSTVLGAQLNWQF